MKYENVKVNLVRYFDLIKTDSVIEEYIKQVSDYVNFASSTYLRWELKQIDKEGLQSYASFLKKSKVLNEAIDGFISSLRGCITRVHIEDGRIKSIFDNEIDGMMSGRISSSQSRSEYLLFHVYDVLNILKSLGKESEVKELAHMKGFGWSLSIDELIKEYGEEKEHYEEDREKDLWGCWDYISVVPRTRSFIHTKDFKGFGDGIDYENQFVLKFYVDLFHAVRSVDLTSQARMKNVIRDKLQRIHGFLLRKIDEDSEAKVWTRRGILNILNADVGPILLNILGIIISAYLGYLFGKLK